MKVGSKVRCEQCGSEAIVIRDGGGELTCCERPVVTIGQK
ncbi:desulfoferrodoxin [Dactylosporangium sp. CA-092794]